MPYAKQITAMRKATAILVATPGRLVDLLDKGEVQLDQFQITVLDEADQMADMGFLPVVKEILDQAKPDGQRLLFSATLDRGVPQDHKNDPYRSGRKARAGETGAVVTLTSSKQQKSVSRRTSRGE